MNSLNFEDDYATVYDLPGVRYQQYGRYFRHDGSVVETEAQEPTRAPDVADIRLKPGGWSEDDLRRPENKALKAQLEVYGEEYTTRRAAIEFLQKGRE